MEGDEEAQEALGRAVVRHSVLTGSQRVVVVSRDGRHHQHPLHERAWRVPMEGPPGGGVRDPRRQACPISAAGSVLSQPESATVTVEWGQAIATCLVQTSHHDTLNGTNGPGVPARRLAEPVAQQVGSDAELTCGPWRATQQSGPPWREAPGGSVYGAGEHGVPRGRPDGGDPAATWGRGHTPRALPTGQQLPGAAAGLIELPGHCRGERGTNMSKWSLQEIPQPWTCQTAK